MNPLATLHLASTTTADRVSAAGRRTSAAARRLALRTAAAVEPADLLVGLAGRSRVRVPRWWTAFQAGDTVPSRPAAVAMANTKQTDDCVAC